ncbi:hypothetical protein AMECASPLE_029042 [Ameca splendens]|uniref:Uncharacterized protein n=1 Tax=Ameca splendens TaxID=208324 RepID=A0ABV0Z4C9_9TELE
MNTNKRAELLYGSSMNPLLHLKAFLLSSYYLNIIKFLTTFTETCKTLSSASRHFFWIPQTSGNSYVGAFPYGKTGIWHYSSPFRLVE